MTDPRTPDSRRHDPANPQAPLNAPYGDPAVDPRIANQTVVQPRSGSGGLIAAGILAVLLVIGVIAFTSTPSTDPATTAVIPEQTTEEMAPAPEAAPAQPAAPAPEGSAPLEETPAAPTDEAPAADQ